MTKKEIEFLIWRRKTEYKSVKGKLEEVLAIEEIKEIKTKDNYTYLDPKNIKLLANSISFTLGEKEDKDRVVVQKNNIEEIIVE